jgi:hypothetical protein
LLVSQSNVVTLRVVPRDLCGDGKWNVWPRSRLSFERQRREAIMTPTTPSATSEAQPVRAYLFHCTAARETHALTQDLTAANLPAGACLTGWVYDGEVRVSVSEPLPFRLSPEPVLRGLRAQGYFIWHDNHGPSATTQ